MIFTKSKPKKQETNKKTLKKKGICYLLKKSLNPLYYNLQSKRYSEKKLIGKSKHT